MSLLPKIFPQNDYQKRVKLESDLIRYEAKIGGELFGPLAKDRERQFFCLDESTWVWFEAWKENGERKARTTRYILRHNKVLKTHGDGRFTPLSPAEARNLDRAIQLYEQRVDTAYDHMLAAAA